MTRAPKERAAFLEEACEGDERLAQQVELSSNLTKERGFYRVTGLRRRSRASD